MVAQKPGADSITKPIDHTFSMKENDWGFSSFIPLSDLLDPDRGIVLPPLSNELQERDYLNVNEKPGSPKVSELAFSYHPRKIPQYDMIPVFGLYITE